jgi:hypothetical protein
LGQRVSFDRLSFSLSCCWWLSKHVWGWSPGLLFGHLSNKQVVMVAVREYQSHITSTKTYPHTAPARYRRWWASGDGPHYIRIVCGYAILTAIAVFSPAYRDFVMTGARVCYIRVACGTRCGLGSLRDCGAHVVARPIPVACGTRCSLTFVAPSSRSPSAECFVRSGGEYLSLQLVWIEVGATNISFHSFPCLRTFCVQETF